MYKAITRQMLLLLFIPVTIVSAQPKPAHNLQFDQLAKKWDEAMPLGNGMLGVLIWEKNNKLRLSLDRADLWDERKVLEFSKLNFKWVEEQVIKKDYKPVQNIGDAAYHAKAYPTKLPAAAMEFDISTFGKVISNVLDIKSAISTIKFESGVVFNCYIHATQPRGYFVFENLPAAQQETTIAAITPQLVVHNYNGQGDKTNDNTHAGEGLEKLGYARGTVTTMGNTTRYHQPTYDNHYYEVQIQWKRVAGNKLVGNWTISCDTISTLPAMDATIKDKASHLDWWKKFWAQSAVNLPDPLIEKQYYLEQYKLGSASRANAPAITLQAVWTADNGSLPPWRGDFHNDLNTQLSYWPVYTGNHLAEGDSYINWLWNNKAKNTSYTKEYFGVDGLNVPGVATLSGDPMGGWIQYSLSPTVGAWCSQYFYWHWKYSMDPKFLKDKAYPYIHDAATFLENITRYKDGVRKLPLSSSPEYNDNDISAWFFEWSNFDLSLAKFLFTIATEVATASNKMSEASHWQQILKQLPDYEVNETGFTIAPGQNLNSSHRHMSQYMAIYPLALLDINKESDKVNIENSLKRIEQKGTRAWCGYSFSWMASLYARAYKADSAVRQLQIFASNFCSPNSFHLNGDQKKGQYSGFTYRPFTLEGNFAFAQGVNELLLQSRNGYLQVFPAIPSSWQNVSFTDLRGEGAFLVSAKKENGAFSPVKVVAEHGGNLRIKLPFENWRVKGIAKISIKKDAAGILSVSLKEGQQIVFENEAE
ncbi:MAG: DUF5703 domain-containing protein [Bacteroidota bacterium]